MKSIYKKIWQMALQYQDKRGDKGHAKITTSYAIQLLETENGNEEIIIPSIILHDTGWSQLNKLERMIIFNQNSTKEKKLKMRLKHQEEGMKIGKEILTQINYPADLIKEIVEIISQHDTRNGFISQNEGLVRDADKLWRFSKTGFIADLTRKKISFKQLYNDRVNRINSSNFFYSEKAKYIANNELKKRLHESIT